MVPINNNRCWCSSTMQLPAAGPHSYSPQPTYISPSRSTEFFSHPSSTQHFHSSDSEQSSLHLQQLHSSDSLQSDLHSQLYSPSSSPFSFHLQLHSVSSTPLSLYSQQLHSSDPLQSSLHLQPHSLSSSPSSWHSQPYSSGPLQSSLHSQLHSTSSSPSSLHSQPYSLSSSRQQLSGFSQEPRSFYSGSTVFQEPQASSGMLSSLRHLSTPYSELT